jgi:thioredoxin 1
MPTVDLTLETFEDTIRDNDVILVDFWAEWCGPCRAFAPTYAAAAADNPDLVFAKVDTEAQEQLAGSFGIRSIPTLMVFREQVLLYSQPGALPRSALDNLIAQIRALDMDDVRRQIAEHENEHSTAD